MLETLSLTELHRRWPTGAQAELLKVVTAPGSVVDAWKEWEARYPIRDTDVFRLIPALYRRLSQEGFECRSYIKGVMRHCYASGVAQQEIARVTSERLEAAGFKVLALKGLALSKTLGYTPRHMGDVDLMVPDRAAEALDIVAAEGWHQGSHDIEYLKAIAGSGVSHAQGFRRGNFELDLHWHAIHQDRSASFDGPLWKRAVLKNGTLVPCMTDMLFLTVIHGIRRESCPEAWPLDLWSIVQAYPDEAIDWDSLIQTAGNRRLWVPLKVLLAALEEYTRVEVPDTVSRTIRGVIVPDLEVMEQRALSSRTCTTREMRSAEIMAYRRSTTPGHMEVNRGRMST